MGSKAVPAPYTLNTILPGNLTLNSSVVVTVGSTTLTIGLTNAFSIKGITDKGLSGLDGNWSGSATFTTPFDPHF